VRVRNIFSHYGYLTGNFADFHLLIIVLILYRKDYLHGARKGMNKL
jgi:hypothetical protein